MGSQSGTYSLLFIFVLLSFFIWEHIHHLSLGDALDDVVRHRALHAFGEEGLGGGGFLAMLDIVQKFLYRIASVAVFSQIDKLAYRKRVVFQINALVSTKSLTPGLAATCQQVVPVE